MCGVLIWVYMLVKKIQAILKWAEYTCFTEVHLSFHRTMTIHIGYQGFCGSYAFRCRIGLKLFLRLALATCEGNTKFGIFRDGLLLSEV